VQRSVLDPHRGVARRDPEERELFEVCSLAAAIGTNRPSSSRRSQDDV
jgi:hypothetical protein